MDKASRAHGRQCRTAGWLHEEPVVVGELQACIDSLAVRDDHRVYLVGPRAFKRSSGDSLKIGVRSNSTKMHRFELTLAPRVLAIDVMAGIVVNSPAARDAAYESAPLVSTVTIGMSDQPTCEHTDPA